MTDKEQEHKDDLEYLMSSLSGRRVLAKFMMAGGLWRQITPGRGKETTDFLLGMRHMALTVHDDLQKYCPAQLLGLTGEIFNAGKDAGESNESLDDRRAE